MIYKFFSVCITMFFLLNIGGFIYASDIFLNEGVSFEIEELPVDFKDDIENIKIIFSYRGFNYIQHFFAKDEISTRKLKLMEYYTLNRFLLSDNIVSISFLNMMDRENLKQFYKRLYMNYHLFQELKYPEEIRSLHKSYVDIFEKAAGIYLDVKDKDYFENVTVLGRIMQNFNEFSTLEKFYQTNLKLFQVLKENEIHPGF